GEPVAPAYGRGGGGEGHGPARRVREIQAAMILRREHPGPPPAVFRSMTGLTVAAFDRMLPGLLAAFEADRRRRLDRPGRQRAPGGGDALDLAAADQFLLTAV